MRANFSRILTLTFIAVFIFGCKKQTEKYESATLADYLPLQTGKYITYRLDSMVFTNLGLVQETHKYQEKQVVDAQFNDNAGRNSYRILRYLRDSAGLNAWRPANVFYITPTDKTIEVVENNLRSVRLALPIKEGYSWKGNQYLADEPYAGEYSFSNDNFMVAWDFTYTGPTTESINGKTIPDVLTVNIAEESGNIDNNFKVVKDTSYAFRNFSVDKYAKGIGLVYQELVMWDHEPNKKPDPSKNPPYSFAPFNRGFGVKRTMIDHN